MKSPRLLCACFFALTAASAAPVEVAAQTPPRQLRRPGALPELPLTQLDDRSLAAELDNRTFTLTLSQPILVRDLLLVLVRGTSLSIVPDPGATGSFIGELKNVTVRQALELVLPPFGLAYAVDGTFIRVFRREPETRLFDINYLAVERGASRTVGGADPAGSFAHVVTASSGDLFADIAKGVQTLLSERAAFNVDRTAGLLQVTDFPERLEQVSLYLDTVHDRVHRQVQLDARVIEVTLNDARATSLDWAALAEAVAGPDSREGSPAPTIDRPMITALGARGLPRFLSALAAQGQVTVLATPRLLALNNQSTIVRAVTHTRSTGGADARDEAITLSVTPQISSEGIVTVSLSPVVTVHGADADGRTPGIRSTRETDTVARVADGETIVLAGFTRDQDAVAARTGAAGWFGRSRTVSRRRVELVVLLTPKILVTPGAP